MKELLEFRAARLVAARIVLANVGNHKPVDPDRIEVDEKGDVLVRGKLNQRHTFLIMLFAIAIVATIEQKNETAKRLLGEIRWKIGSSWEAKVIENLLMGFDREISTGFADAFAKFADANPVVSVRAGVS